MFKYLVVAVVLSVVAGAPQFYNRKFDEGLF